MAWIIENKTGSKAVQFDLNGKIKTITVMDADGAKSKYKVDARQFQTHIEHLVRAKESGGIVQIPSTTMAWLDSVQGSPIEKRLVKLELIASREPITVVTISDWLQRFIDSRPDVKESTRITYGNIQRNLTKCFDARKSIASFTPGDGDLFRAWLVGTENLAENTVRQRIRLARQVFAAAIRAKLLTENPFAHLSAHVRGNAKTFHYVSMADYQKLVRAAPDSDWKAIIALSRIGGIRCPSEVLALTWPDIDWERMRVRITSPKTEGHDGHAERIIPLFPQLHDVLRDAFDAADDGTLYVVNRYRDSGQNLRTTFAKIIARAGLTKWPKLFHNMRASRATELVAEFPQHVCSSWMGHSADVASEHYLRVRDTDFDKATSRPTLSATLSAVNANDDASAQNADVSRQANSKKTSSDANNVGVSRNDKSVTANGWGWRDSNPHVLSDKGF